MPKNCYLTDCGLHKLEIALSKFPDTCKTDQKPFPANVNLSELERHSGKQRETLKKILSGTRGVNQKTLDELFTSLDIDLEQDDYEQREGARKNANPNPPPNQTAIANTHQESGDIKIVVSESGIPKVIRMLSQDNSNL